MRQFSKRTAQNPVSAGLQNLASCHVLQRKVNTNQLVRDLRWVITSPSLINIARTTPIRPTNTGPIENFGLPDNWVPDPVADNLNALMCRIRNHRVGHYFEQLILYWLVQLRNCNDVRHGVQIREENRTVGEIDFMFTDESGRRTHWETAVKFYLHCPLNSSSESHFIGPNAADNFEKKTQRMLGHQLSMSRRYEDVVVREPFVKGRIFYHPDIKCPTDLPKHLSPQHLSGSWIRQSELDWLASTGVDSKFRVLRKPFWLANEFMEPGDQSLLSTAAIIDHLNDQFGESDRPVLVSRLEPDNQGYVEADRVFVVSNHWPGS